MVLTVSDDGEMVICRTVPSLLIESIVTVIYQI
jgi:hypothetical protein